MIDYLWVILVVLMGVFGFPVFVFICAKMWTLGVLSGQCRFYKMMEEKEGLDGDEESQV